MLDVLRAPYHLFLQDLECVKLVSLPMSNQLDLAETSLSKTLQDVEVFEAEVFTLFRCLFRRAVGDPMYRLLSHLSLFPFYFRRILLSRTLAVVSL